MSVASMQEPETFLLQAAMAAMQGPTAAFIRSAVVVLTAGLWPFVLTIISLAQAKQVVRGAKRKPTVVVFGRAHG